MNAESGSAATRRRQTLAETRLRKAAHQGPPPAGGPLPPGGPPGPPCCCCICCIFLRVSANSAALTEPSLSLSIVSKKSFMRSGSFFLAQFSVAVLVERFHIELRPTAAFALAAARARSGWPSGRTGDRRRLVVAEPFLHVHFFVGALVFAGFFHRGPGIEQHFVALFHAILDLNARVVAHPQNHGTLFGTRGRVHPAVELPVLLDDGLHRNAQHVFQIRN